MRKKAFLFVPLALWGGLITACNNAPQTSTPSPFPATESITTPATTPTTGSMAHHAGMMHGDMSLGPADADYDLRFIDAMIPHHEGAVIMAKSALQHAQHPELKKLANAIIQAQTQEIAQMQQWRKQWYPQASKTPMAWYPEHSHMMPMMAEQREAMMMSVDLGSGDADYDVRFIDAMIPHHEGAVVMAKDVLQKSKRPETRKLAQAIISSQSTEINQMQQWRQAWGTKG